MKPNLAEQVQIGVVGCGSVFRNYGAMIRVLELEGLARLAVASDVNADAEQQVRSYFREAPFSTEPRDVIEADDVDLVVVLTSPPVHDEVARAALNAGKHVMVEKPMATTLGEAEELVALAREKSLQLACAPHVVLSHTFRMMLKEIDKGSIGRVSLARARYGEGNLSWGQWRYAGPGSGPLLECGVYNITTLTGLLGPAHQVMAMAGITVPDREISGSPLEVETYDHMQVLIEFADGAIGSVTTGYTMLDSRGPAVELYGTEGVIQMLGQDWAPHGYEIKQAANPEWRTVPDPEPAWHWTEGLRHLVECIRTGQNTITSPEHAIHVQEIMLKAEVAAADGRSVEIHSTFPRVELKTGDVEFDREQRRRIAVAR